MKLTIDGLEGETIAKVELVFRTKQPLTETGDVLRKEQIEMRLAYIARGVEEYLERQDLLQLQKALDAMLEGEPRVEEIE